MNNDFLPLVGQFGESPYMRPINETWVSGVLGS